MTFRLGNRGWRLTGATVAICAAGGVAYAAIPGSNGVINGCYRSRQDLPQLRDGDQLEPEPPGRTQRTQGPKGDQGEQGPMGATGPKGDKGDPGS